MRKKTLKQDLRDAVAGQRYETNRHSYGVPSWQIDKEWREFVREAAKDVAERAHELRLGGLDPYERDPDLCQRPGENVDYVEARQRQDRAAGILQALAVLAVASSGGGDWSALPEWIAEEWERRRAGGALEALDVDVEGFITAEALRLYQQLEASDR